MQVINSLVLAQDFPSVPGGVSVYVENLFRNLTGRAIILAPECGEPANDKDFSSQPGEPWACFFAELPPASYG